jgi:tetratricopeptide (TPR) repeat protein
MILPATAEETGGLCMPCFKVEQAQPRNVVQAIEQLTDSQLQGSASFDIASKLADIIERCPDGSLSNDESALLVRSLSILDRLESLGQNNNRLLILKLMALGKLGRFDEAITEAEKQYQNAPSWHTAIGVANAYRRSGDIDRALEMFTAAADHDSKDVTALLEIGDLYLERAEWQFAIDHYERVLSRQPDQEWAIPSIHYCRYQQTGERAWLSRLEELASAPADACGVEGMLAQLTGSYSADQRRLRAQQLLEDFGT